VVGQAEVVVAGQVDDLFAVVVTDGGLLVIENAEPEVGALGAEFIKRSSQVSKLGTCGGLGHGGYLKHTRIARMTQKARR
jgi:hypothetical protein